MELIKGGKSLEVMKIQRGIFQVDEFSLLLFIKAMIPLNHIFKKYTGSMKLKKNTKRLITLSIRTILGYQQIMKKNG